jgi:hypothetical protein
MIPTAGTSGAAFFSFISLTSPPRSSAGHGKGSLMKIDQSAKTLVCFFAAASDLTPLNPV